MLTAIAKAPIINTGRGARPENIPAIKPRVNSRLGQKRCGRRSGGDAMLTAAPPCMSAGFHSSRLRSDKPRYQARLKVATRPRHMAGRRGMKRSDTRSRFKAAAALAEGPPQGTRFITALDRPKSVARIKGFIPIAR